MPYSTYESLCAHLNVHPKLQQAIKALGYKIPTEIQKLAIPEVIKGKDILASAETGSGKTVAFALPALHRLMANPPAVNGRGPRVLILTPTRELASQITDAIANLSKFANFRFGIITGGVGYPAQEQLLRRPLDILVATPGRLMDHMSRNRVDFSRLEMFILDEADRMLDMGFVGDMEHIAAALPIKHQTLLFSATLEGEVQRISRKFLKDPVCIQLAVATKKHTLISQRVHLVDNWNHKRALLSHILEDANMWQAIVFTATKRGADDLVDELISQGVPCAALHGDMKQSQRSRTIEKMHRGLRVLVATDVAARGLDIKKLSHVVNFDMPKTGEDYTHRIGRTGRCGEKGTAISFVGPKDGALLAQIERFTGQKLERQVVPGFESKIGFTLNGGGGARPKSKGKPSRRRPLQSNNSERSFHGFGKSAKRPPSFKQGESRRRAR